jgi:glycosyltransferase involved in cell wall biosynthesis
MGKAKKKKFSFCIPNYKCSDTLAKCLGSIKDQDYPEVEIIVVNDSPDPSADEVLKAFSEVKTTCTGPEPMGAPYARNLAYSMSTGDYISFLDPDTYLLPGAIRAWSEAFDENPDCGFVYSGYKIKGLEGFYPSEPFDPYFLEINNYINGMNPMRREVFPSNGWDVNCKSLQDWDLWLRIIKSGVKGYYLGDKVFYYETEPPKKQGISADSHNNWLARKEYIQKKLNLPVRDICITSLAAPEHARRISKLMGIDYCYWEMLSLKPHKYKLVYLLGMFPGNGSRNFVPFYSNESLTFKPNLKCVIHWIGTDIVHMRTMATFQQLQALVTGYNKRFTQFCQSESNQKELKELGIKAELLPLPVEVPIIKAFDMPVEFTVAIYDHGQSREDVYCKALMSDIVKSCPDIKFIFFGEEHNIGKENNYQFLGRVNIDDVIKQSSCLLRITRHDGFPVTPVEFIVHNRPTITSNKYPYQIKVDFDGTLSDMNVPVLKKRIINELRKLKANESEKIDFDAARNYYRQILSPHKLKRRLKTLSMVTTVTGNASSTQGGGK